MKHLFVLSLVLGLSACAQTPGSVAHPALGTGDGQTEAVRKPKVTALQLLGKDDAWVLANMGAPAFMRADRVAHIWQYKNTACVLNVFLYTDDAAASSAKHVLHFDARDNGGNNTNRDTCLSDLQAE